MSTLQLICNHAEMNDQDNLNKLRTCKEIMEVAPLIKKALKRISQQRICWVPKNPSSMAKNSLVNYMYNMVIKEPSEMAKNSTLSTRNPTFSASINNLPDDVLELIKKYSFQTIEERLNSIKTRGDLREFTDKYNKRKNQYELEFIEKFSNNEEIFKCDCADRSTDICKFKKHEKDKGGYYIVLDIIYVYYPDYNFGFTPTNGPTRVIRPYEYQLYNITIMDKVIENGTTHYYS